MCRVLTGVAPAVALAGVISISITFFNKAVFSVYDFRYSNALTLGQVLSCLAFLFYMRRQGWIQSEPLKWHLAIKVRYRTWHARHRRRAVLPSLSRCARDRAADGSVSRCACGRWCRWQCRSRVW